MNTPVREGETIEGSRTTRNRPYPVLKCSRCRGQGSVEALVGHTAGRWGFGRSSWSVPTTFARTANGAVFAAGAKPKVPTAAWATERTCRTSCCPRRSRRGRRGSEKPAQMDKEGMLWLLAALSSRRGFGSAPRRGRARGWARQQRRWRRLRTMLVLAEAVAEMATGRGCGGGCKGGGGGGDCQGESLVRGSSL